MEETMGRVPGELWTRRQVIAATAVSASLLLKNRPARPGRMRPWILIC